MLFADRLTTGLIRARRESTQLALVYIDIDRFKPVNDRYGHGAGDVLLKAIAARLRSEEHTSELQSLMRISYAVFCLKKKPHHTPTNPTHHTTHPTPPPPTTTTPHTPT